MFTQVNLCLRVHCVHSRAGTRRQQRASEVVESYAKRRVAGLTAPTRCDFAIRTPHAPGAELGVLRRNGKTKSGHGGECLTEESERLARRGHHAPFLVDLMTHTQRHEHEHGGGIVRKGVADRCGT